jgi:hypothetical protein
LLFHILSQNFHTLTLNIGFAKHPSLALIYSLCDKKLTLTPELNMIAPWRSLDFYFFAIFVQMDKKEMLKIS